MIEQVTNHRMRIIQMMDEPLQRYSTGLNIIGADITYMYVTDPRPAQGYAIILTARAHTPNGTPILGDVAFIHHVHIIGYWPEPWQVDEGVRDVCNELRKKQADIVKQASAIQPALPPRNGQTPV